MSVLGGLVVGVFGTALLDAAVSSPKVGKTTVAAKGLGGAFGVVRSGLSRIVDPSIPAVPNRSGTSSSGSSSGSAASGSTPVGPAANGGAIAPFPYAPNVGGLWGAGFGPSASPSTPVSITPNRTVPASDLPGRPGSGVSP